MPGRLCRFQTTAAGASRGAEADVGEDQGQSPAISENDKNLKSVYEGEEGRPILGTLIAREGFCGCSR
jgi:hypothetical protein